MIGVLLATRDASIVDYTKGLDVAQSLGELEFVFLGVGARPLSTATGYAWLNISRRGTSCCAGINHDGALV